MQQHNPSKPEVLCVVCKERKAQGAIGDGIPVCGECLTWHNLYARGSTSSGASGAEMATRPTVQQRWSRNADKARKMTIEHADAALSLLDDALDKLSRRAHPAETALDITSAARYLEIIKRLMTEAKVGIE